MKKSLYNFGKVNYNLIMNGDAPLDSNEKYWQEVEKLNAEINAATELMKLTKSNKVWESLNMRLYDLRQQKKQLQINRGEAIKQRAKEARHE